MFCRISITQVEKGCQLSLRRNLRLNALSETTSSWDNQQNNEIQGSWLYNVKWTTMSAMFILMLLLHLGEHESQVKSKWKLCYFDDLSKYVVLDHWCLEVFNLFTLANK